MFCAPCIHFYPHNSRAFKRGNSFSNFQKTVQSLLPLLVLYYPFLFYLLLHPPHSLWLYTSWEKWNGSFSFFLEVLTLITVPHFVYSSVFTDWQGLEFPRLVHASLLPATLIPHPWPVTHCHQPQVMKWMKFLSRNISLPNIDVLTFKI